MTSLTFVAVALMIFASFSSKGFAPALAIAGALPAGAAVALGGVNLPMFWAVAGACVLGFAVRPKSQEPSGAPGTPRLLSILLTALVMWAIVLTLLSPFIFPGQPVLDSAGNVQQLSPGHLTQSNIAQLLYLATGAGVVLYLASRNGTTVRIVGLCAGFAILLSFWSWTSTRYGLPYPRGVFDNSGTFAYQDALPGGKPRVRGIFPEPSALAAGCLVLIAYSVASLASASARRKGLLLVAIFSALWLGSISTSTTFVVAGVILGLTYTLWYLLSFVRNRIALGFGTVLILLPAAVTVAWFAPKLYAAFLSEIDDKLGSFSYADRSNADDVSIHIFFSTNTLGSGVGSNRASSFVAGTLSTLGLIGTALLLSIIIVLLIGARRHPSFPIAFWSFSALLICKALAGPDLNDPTGLLWIHLGVFARMKWQMDESGLEGVRTKTHDAAVDPGTKVSNSMPG